jgi:hypothetical protein
LQGLPRDIALRMFDADYANYINRKQYYDLMNSDSAKENHHRRVSEEDQGARTSDMRMRNLHEMDSFFGPSSTQPTNRQTSFDQPPSRELKRRENITHSSSLNNSRYRPIMTNLRNVCEE